MKGAKKFQQMMNFEISNCKKNISFYRGQMRRNHKNKGFYAEEIVFMQKKLDRLQLNFPKASFWNYKLLSRKI